MSNVTHGQSWSRWRKAAWSFESGWGTPSATAGMSCEKQVVDFLYVNNGHQSRCTCSASRFYCHRRNTCTMGWWHRTCGPNQEMCYFAVPLHSSRHWVHEPQHGSPDNDICPGLPREKISLNTGIHVKMWNVRYGQSWNKLKNVGTHEGTLPGHSNLAEALHLQLQIRPAKKRLLTFL